MIKIYLIKYLNIFRFLIYRVIDFIISFPPQIESPNTLFIIRLDSIGDYILLRNFLGTFRKSEQYNKYKITLCGNKIWKEIADEYDRDIIDDFLWMDRKKFSNNFIYKYKFLKKIYKAGFEVAVDMTFTRELLFGDSIIKTSHAKVRIGSEGSLEKHTAWKRKLLTDRYYTRLFPASKTNLFEFFRNKNFFEELLGFKIDIRKPSLPDTTKVSSYSFSGKYAVIFPGAADSWRKWKPAYFTKVLKFIRQHYNFLVIIAGSQRDTKIAQSITSGIDNSDFRNLTGKTSLLELIELMRNAEILISNETGAVHIAVAVDTPFVCISNGNHFGRFNPYPKEIYDKGFYVYPSEITGQMDNYEYLAERYRFSSNLDINEIKPETVIKIILRVLNS